MDEIIEAKRFSQELDKLLSGKSGGAEVPGELGKDLEAAARICRMNLSGESRVKGSLKAKFLWKPAPSRVGRPFAWLIKKPRIMVAFAGLAVLVLVPLGLHLLSSLTDEYAQGDLFAPGFASRGNSRAFGGSSSPYETGGSSFAPGSLLGATEYSGSSDDGGPRRRRSSLDESADSRQDLSPDAQVKLLRHDEDGEPTKFNTEAYDYIQDNPYLKTTDNPLSTFSIDVDAASYANVRRFLNESTLPPKGAVRIEELVNYFRYDYPEPRGEHPFSITTDLAVCPWNPEHKLVRIGIKGRAVAVKDMPPSNLVFLIDSSGSMDIPDKLPLLQKALGLLVAELRPQDRISIVTYAGAAGLVLPSTPGDQKEVIMKAIAGISAGGSTNGGEGIQLAYKTAAENLIKDGNNRVILATDGDFNVGVTNDGDLVSMMEEQRGHGVFLTILGFGEENLRDSMMEKVADKGDGNYFYIDSILEARKVLVEELTSTLLTIAKDVKIQVEFNPAHAQAYRLLGYEDRMLKAEDFNDDKKDAGELGAGHSVTALYEVIPDGVKMELPGIDELKYQKPREAGSGQASGELLTVKFRYKEPDGDKSKLSVAVLGDNPKAWIDAPKDFQFAAAVAGFGMLLRGSKNAGDLDYGTVGRMAEVAVGKDKGGYRAEFVTLVEKATLLETKKN